MSDRDSKLPRVTVVVASARNGVIGANGAMPWRLSADLKHFRETTMGHTVIMGRKTFASIGKPLPGRTNVVLSRDPDLQLEGAEVEGSLQAALQAAAQRGEEEAMVIGGGQIYAEAMPLAHRVWLTEVDAEPAGDTFFPPLAEGEWVQRSQRLHAADERNQYATRILCFERLSKAP